MKPLNRLPGRLLLLAGAIAQGDVEAVQWAVFTNPGHRNMGLIDLALGSGQVRSKLGKPVAASFQAGRIRLDLSPDPLYVIGG